MKRKPINYMANRDQTVHCAHICELNSEFLHELSREPTHDMRRSIDSPLLQSQRMSLSSEETNPEVISKKYSLTAQNDYFALNSNSCGRYLENFLEETHKMVKTAADGEGQIVSSNVEEPIPELRKKAASNSTGKNLQNSKPEVITNPLKDLAFNLSSNYTEEENAIKASFKGIPESAQKRNFGKMKKNYFKSLAAFFLNPSRKKGYAKLCKTLYSMKQWNSLFSSKLGSLWIKEYLKFLASFNPEEFRARQIANDDIKITYEMLTRAQKVAAVAVIISTNNLQFSIVSFRITKVSKTSVEFRFRTDNQANDKVILKKLDMLQRNPSQLKLKDDIMNKTARTKVGVASANIERASSKITRPDIFTDPVTNDDQWYREFFRNSRSNNMQKDDYNNIEHKPDEGPDLNEGEAVVNEKPDTSPEEHAPDLTALLRNREVHDRELPPNLSESISPDDDDNFLTDMVDRMCNELLLRFKSLTHR